MVRTATHCAPTALRNHLLATLAINIWPRCGQDMRALLQGLGLPSWIKTTGSKGFHIAVPLDAKADFGTVAHFAHRAGKFRKLLVARDPENLTREFLKVDRRGRILVQQIERLPKIRIVCGTGDVRK